MPSDSDARAALLECFRWQGHHADLWRIFRDRQALTAVVSAVADPFRDSGLDAVVGIESRGFLLGGAVAVELGVGFVAVRKAGSLFPGPKVRRRTGSDYRGNSHELLMRSDDLGSGDRVVLVDDWAETGAQATAVAGMVRDVGAELVGLSIMVDELAEEVRSQLPPVHSLLTGAELPDWPG